MLVRIDGFGADVVLIKLAKDGEIGVFRVEGAHWVGRIQGLIRESQKLAVFLGWAWTWQRCTNASGRAAGRQNDQLIIHDLYVIDKEFVIAVECAYQFLGYDA